MKHFCGSVGLVVDCMCMLGVMGDRKVTRGGGSGCWKSRERILEIFNDGSNGCGMRQCGADCLGGMYDMRIVSGLEMMHYR